MFLKMNWRKEDLKLIYNLAGLEVKPIGQRAASFINLLIFLVNIDVYI